MHLADVIDKYPKSRLIIFVAVLVVVIGAVDYLTGAETASSIFYLLPISIAAWFIGKDTAIFISVLSTLTWFIADVTAKTYSIHPLIHFWNFVASFSIFLIFSFLVSGLKNTLNKEKFLSRTDYLTNLFNRRGFIELAETEIKRLRRFGHPFTLAYMDIDNFKTVNDTLGHKTGDMLLYSVAVTMQNNIRETDIAGRVGGDEFAMVMPETKYDQSEILIRRLLSQLLDIMQRNNYPVTFSIGAITFYESPISVDEVLSKTDKVMYSVKNSGKNNIRHEVFGKCRESNTSNV